MIGFVPGWTIWVHGGRIYKIQLFFFLRFLFISAIIPFYTINLLYYQFSDGLRPRQV